MVNLRFTGSIYVSYCSSVETATDEAIANRVKDVNAIRATMDKAVRWRAWSTDPPQCPKYSLAPFSRASKACGTFLPVTKDMMTNFD